MNSERWLRTVVFSLSFTLTLVAAHAQSAVADNEETVTTQHTITVDGKPLAYTAHAGYLSLRDPQTRLRGRMFYVSYSAGHAGTKRPLIFVWNGGPGSNASMLELAALGPRRLPMQVKGNAELVDNDETWLSFADLVFIDPIYAGYSYAATPEDQKQFLNDRGDAESFAEFIRLYRAHYQTQQQPVYLVGESYGTYRAVGVADVLSRRDIPLAGIMLLSNLFSFSHGAELDSVFLLPNYTAAAFAHGRLTGDLQKSVEKSVAESERFALQNYLPALAQGDRLTAEEKRNIATQLARLTGVSAEEWMRHDLRIDQSEFALLLVDVSKGDYAAHYDTRLTGHGQPGAPYDVSRDPSLQYGVNDAMVPYLRNELGWKSDALYAGPWGGRWPTPESPRGDWTSLLWNQGTEPQERASLLTEVLQRNARMHVVIANGLYDFATPFAASEYDVAHLGLNEEQKSRLRIVRYESGHSPYTSTEERQKLLHDAKTLLDGTLTQ